MSISAYGNKQVNIRFESDLLEEIKTAAETDGIGLQDWVRNACRSALGQSVPGAVGKSEFEATIAKLTEQIESAKASGGTNQVAVVSPEPVNVEGMVADAVSKAMAPLNDQILELMGEIEDVKKL